MKKAIVFLVLLFNSTFFFCQNFIQYKQTSFFVSNNKVKKAQDTLDEFIYIKKGDTLLGIQKKYKINF